MVLYNLAIAKIIAKAQMKERGGNVQIMCILRA